MSDIRRQMRLALNILEYSASLVGLDCPLYLQTFRWSGLFALIFSLTGNLHVFNLMISSTMISSLTSVECLLKASTDK